MILLLVGMTCSAIGQEFDSEEAIETDSITVQAKGLKLSYHLGMATLETEELKDLLRKDPTSLRWFREGQTLVVVGTVTNVAGGFLFGFSVGDAIVKSAKSEVNIGGDKVKSPMNWMLFGIGVGMLVPGTIMTVLGKKNKTQAIDRYNSSVKAEPIGLLYMGPTRDGLGFCFQF